MEDGEAKKFEGSRTSGGIVEAARNALPNKVFFWITFRMCAFLVLIFLYSDFFYKVTLLKKKINQTLKKQKKAKVVLSHKKNKTPDVWKALAVTNAIKKTFFYLFLLL